VQGARVKAITSESNAAFRRWLRIATLGRGAREAGQTLAEGLHLAQAAIEAGVAIDAVIVRRGAALPEALLAALPASAAHFEMAPVLYERLAPVEQGSGLLLVLPLPPAVQAAPFSGDGLYLDGVQDPGNAGAILRTAAAAGVRYVLAGTGTAALWAPKVLRAAMGAHFRLDLYERIEPGALQPLLDGPWIAAVAHAGASLWEQDFGSGAVGWVLGAEGAGPSPAALAACRHRVCIPTSDAVESLNVAAAAAVCLFERLRRR